MADIDLITLPEASRLLRVKISTLRAWKIQRRLPFIKLAGGKILLRRSDVEKLVEASVIPAKAGAR